MSVQDSLYRMGEAALAAVPVTTLGVLGGDVVLRSLAVEHDPAVLVGEQLRGVRGAASEHDELGAARSLAQMIVEVIRNRSLTGVWLGLLRALASRASAASPSARRAGSIPGCCASIVLRMLPISGTLAISLSVNRSARRPSSRTIVDDSAGST